MAINGHADADDGAPAVGRESGHRGHRCLSGLQRHHRHSAAVGGTASRTGRGQHIDIARARFDRAVRAANQIATYFITGKTAERVRQHVHVKSGTVPIIQTADGYMIVGAGNDSQWRKYEAMGVLKWRSARIPGDEGPQCGTARNWCATWKRSPRCADAALVDTSPAVSVSTRRSTPTIRCSPHPQVQHRALRRWTHGSTSAQGGGTVAMVASPDSHERNVPSPYRHAPPVKGPPPPTCGNQRPTTKCGIAP